jgi:23S rRNA (adenine2030-N6)-methyltransferase
VKDVRGVASLARQIAQSGVRRVLRLEVAVDAVAAGGRLARTGLILINPPYVIEEEAAVLLPLLTRKFARTSQSEATREWLAGE